MFEPGPVASPQLIPPSDPDALLCALVLVPGSYSRNQFFDIFELPELRRARRRAKRLRGIIRQLLGEGRQRAEIVGRQQVGERVLLRFSVPGVAFQRTTLLTQVEAALIGYATSRARRLAAAPEDKALVEKALSRLGETLGLPPRIASANDPPLTEDHQTGGRPDTGAAEPATNSSKPSARTKEK